MQEPKITHPTLPITDPAFVYRPAAATDITITWRKFGWVPKNHSSKTALDVFEALLELPDEVFEGLRPERSAS
jgi:hypothetical protein